MAETEPKKDIKSRVLDMIPEALLTHAMILFDRFMNVLPCTFETYAWANIVQIESDDKTANYSYLVCSNDARGLTFVSWASNTRYKLGDRVEVIKKHQESSSFLWIKAPGYDCFYIRQWDVKLIGKHFEKQRDSAFLSK